MSVSGDVDVPTLAYYSSARMYTSAVDSVTVEPCTCDDHSALRVDLTTPAAFVPLINVTFVLLLLSLLCSPLLSLVLQLSSPVPT